jgi:hypothetical protein
VRYEYKDHEEPTLADTIINRLNLS